MISILQIFTGSHAIIPLLGSEEIEFGYYPQKIKRIGLETSFSRTLFKIYLSVFIYPIQDP